MDIHIIILLLSGYFSLLYISTSIVKKVKDEDTLMLIGAILFVISLLSAVIISYK